MTADPTPRPEESYTQLWCWSSTPHDPHDWEGTMNGEPRTFHCGGVLQWIVQQHPETPDATAE